MLDQFFTYSYVLARLRGGALGGILDDVAAYLGERGHSRRVGQSYLCAAGHFSHWLDVKGICPSAVNETTLRRALQARARVLRRRKTRVLGPGIPPSIRLGSQEGVCIEKDPHRT